jgi:hypothetical protein
MSTKSKFFRVATEGATTDGRVITRQQIKDMADSFSPQTYGARVWMEHLRSLLPDGPFKAYGDVLAIKAEEVETDGGKRLALFAQISPTPELIAMNQARQKIYTSIEMNPKFSDSGRAYLVGLAVTDSPASLGTEVLAFSSQNPTASPFATRKLSPDNVFTAGEETTLEFEDDGPTVGAKLADTVKALFKRLTSKGESDDARFADVSEAVTTVAEQVGQFAQKAEQAVSAASDTAKRLTALELQFKTEQSIAQAFRDKLDNTDHNREHRPQASGGNGLLLTEF